MAAFSSSVVFTPSIWMEEGTGISDTEVWHPGFRSKARTLFSKAMDRDLRHKIPETPDYWDLEHGGGGIGDTKLPGFGTRNPRDFRHRFGSNPRDLRHENRRNSSDRLLNSPCNFDLKLIIKRTTSGGGSFLTRKRP